MTSEAIIAVSIITAMLTVFGAVLAYAYWLTGREL